MPEGQRGSSCRATATFRTLDEVTKVIKEFNGCRLPQLAGSQVSLSHIMKAKFSTLTQIYEVIKPQIEELQSRTQSISSVQIKIYPAKGRFTTIHAVSSNIEDLGKVKLTLSCLLNGHQARSAQEPIWHQFFLSREGTAYLNTLGADNNAFIYYNAKKHELRLYGFAEERAVVESTLDQVLKDLALSSCKIELDDNLSNAGLQIAYRKIVAELGKSAVRKDTTSTPRTITIEGSVEGASRARAILEEASPSMKDPTNTDTGAEMCAVCWCEISDEGYRTPCGHVYDKGCFASQCSSAGAHDFPIRCLGADGLCKQPILLSELEIALSREELDSLFINAFTQHIRTHPADYQYCPTPSCDQIYPVSQGRKVFTCTACLTSICTTCGVVTHEGLTCEQNKNVSENDEAFAKWKEESSAKDCPKCRSVIEKNGGCRHMQCINCQVHICWVCMATFAEGTATCDHLAKDHGGIFDTNPF